MFFFICGQHLYCYLFNFTQNPQKAQKCTGFAVIGGSRKSGGSLKVSRGGRGEHGVGTGFAVIGVSHKSMESMDILSYADFTDYTDFTEGRMKR